MGVSEERILETAIQEIRERELMLSTVSVVLVLLGECQVSKYLAIIFTFSVISHVINQVHLLLPLISDIRLQFITYPSNRGGLQQIISSWLQVGKSCNKCVILLSKKASHHSIKADQFFTHFACTCSYISRPRVHKIYPPTNEADIVLPKAYQNIRGQTSD